VLSSAVGFEGCESYNIHINVHRYIYIHTGKQIYSAVKICLFLSSDNVDKSFEFVDHGVQKSAKFHVIR
jgi:hypothetical protein